MGLLGLVLCFLVSTCQLVGSGELPMAQIGAILEEADERSEQAFRRAVDLVNKDPDHSLSRFRLDGVVMRVPPSDAFHAHKAACKLLSLGVMAIVGPTSTTGSAAVTAALSRAHVPHLVTLARDSYPAAADSNWTLSSLFLAPSRAQLGMAFRDLVADKGWKSFTFVYEDTGALMRLRELLLLPQMEGLPFRMVQSSQEDDLRKLFRKVGRYGEANILIDAPTDRLREYFSQAHNVGMFTEYHNYIVTSLDLHTVDLRQFYSSRTNLTAFQVVDTTGSLLKLHEGMNDGKRADLESLVPRTKHLQTGIYVRPPLNHV